jgi:hypothetical protein
MLALSDPTSEKPPPINVTLTLPVVGALTCCALLGIGASNDTIATTDPKLTPTDDVTP